MQSDLTGSKANFASVLVDINGSTIVRHFKVDFSESRAAKLLELDQAAVPETNLHQEVGREPSQIVSVHQDQVRCSVNHVTSLTTFNLIELGTSLSIFLTSVISSAINC